MVLHRIRLDPSIPDEAARSILPKSCLICVMERRSNRYRQQTEMHSVQSAVVGTQAVGEKSGKNKRVTSVRDPFYLIEEDSDRGEEINWF